MPASLRSTGSAGLRRPPQSGRDSSTPFKWSQKRRGRKRGSMGRDRAVCIRREKNVMAAGDASRLYAWLERALSGIIVICQRFWHRITVAIRIRDGPWKALRNEISSWARWMQAERCQQSGWWLRGDRGVGECRLAKDRSRHYTTCSGETWSGLPRSNTQTTSPQEVLESDLELSRAVVRSSGGIGAGERASLSMKIVMITTSWQPTPCSICGRPISSDVRPRRKCGSER